MDMPLAVNISYGTNDGAHDGNSLFEGYINFKANTHELMKHIFQEILDTPVEVNLEE